MCLHLASVESRATHECSHTCACAHTPTPPPHTHLLALNAGTNVEPVDKFLQDGSKWCHTDTTANQDGNIVTGPILMTLSVRPIQEEFWPWLSAKHGWVDTLSEVEGPGPNNSDVE